MFVIKIKILNPKFLNFCCCYRETGEDDGPEVQIVDEVINVERKRREAVDLVHDDLLNPLTTIKPELDVEMLTTTTTMAAEPDLEPETTTVEAEPEMETTTALTLESYIDRVNKSSLNFPFIRTTFKEMGERRPDVVPPTFISWLDMASSKL